MKSEQMLMELGVPELKRCDKAGTDEFIANRLSESTTGKIHLMVSICAVENRRAARDRVVRNGGAPGVDGVKARELPGVLNRCWGAIKDKRVLKLIQELNRWIVRRLRVFLWEQRRFRELLKLNVNARQIKMVVSSRKAYWKLSRTLATNMGMGNEWLAEQGLISLKEQWSRIHYPA